MIGPSAKAEAVQRVTQLLDPGAGNRVNDPRFVAMPLHHFADLIPARSSPLDMVNEIGPVKVADEDVRRTHTQLSDDILAYRRRGGSRQCLPRSVRELLPNASKQTVLRTEVVSPRANAMSLVHRETGRGMVPQEAQQLVRQQSLRCHVQQSDPAGGDVAKDLLLATGCQRTVQGRCRYAASAQCVHLILHQRDQGGHDNGHAVAQQSGDLVTDGLAPAGWHHHQRVATQECTADGVFLVGQESVVTPVVPEYLCG